MTHSPLSSGLGLVVVLLFGAGAGAQAGAGVTGTINDQNGAVVVHAQIELLNIASGRSFKTKPDTTGTYAFTGLLPGFYQLSVNGEGFGVATRSIVLRKAGSYTENFILVPGAIETSLTVTAAKGNARVAAEIPQMLTIAGATQIEERRPSATLQAIEKTPNLSTVSANVALQRPRLRGLTSNRLLIILDGDRLNNARSDPTSGVSPSVIDVMELESIEALSGAGSSLYGSDAMAGVINLVTPGPVVSNRPHYLGLRLTGDAHTNGWFRRGAATFNWSEPKFALRLSASLFRGASYHAGGQSILLDEVVRLGRLSTDMGNAIGNSVARTYAVWSLAPGAEIPNGQAHGFNDQTDLWIFPNANHSVRYSQLNSHHYNLGFSFIAPPFDQRTQFNSFRRLDKFALRYEGRELAGWLPRLAASVYGQKYSFPDDTITSPITIGSSWALTPDPNTPQSLLAVLTGNRSSFTTANLSDNKNSITTHALDVQATFAPRLGLMITSGIGYLRDSSADEFSRTDFVAPFNVISSRASTPNSIYRNWGWFNLLEYEPRGWLRLTAGLRVDNWKTEARVTSGFPLGVEARLLDLSFARLVSNPGQIDVSGTAGLLDLIGRVKNISTERTVVTGNAGILVRLPGGFNPYFRWGSSYREPGITERYLLRDFGDPTFSVLVIPNTALRPERGHEYDFGLKVQRSRLNASAAYFVNHLADFVGSAFAPALFVPADPSHGLNPISPFFPFHGVLYVQRTNTARARIEGFEATYEASLSLGRDGTLTPFGSLGLLRGSNLTPDQNTLKLIGQFYNRADTPVPLHGSVNDAPLSSITPLRTINGIRFDSSKQRWFGEYEVRYQARVTRADPLDLSAAISTQYGSLRSLNSFATHTVRGGYSFGKETHRVAFTVGVENLTNRLYFEHFQTAPAPGRSVVLGTTIEWFNLLRR